MLALLAALPLVAHVLAQDPGPFEPPFRLPPVQYLSQYSWRGVDQQGRVPGYDISGQAAALPGVHDFLRLVPPAPLAHGALFSSKPMLAEEWVVEVAFRMHGPNLGGLVDHVSDDPGAKRHKAGKGGRGLAFWYSKSPNVSPITIASDPARIVYAAPGPFPLPADDPNVSFFGYSSTFDGLAVLFDASPSLPVHPRSDPRNLEQAETMGAENSGVVSGLLDDGKRDWLEPGEPSSAGDKGVEALYLASAVGECEAAFRNAHGIIWARVSNFNNTIRVDLDLAPHTTLSKVGRDYAHNCWSMDGVKLEPGSYFGISGMAAGNTEPDSIDVYALDVFEVLKDTAGTPPVDSALPPVTTKPLEGTSNDAEVTLAYEIFLSQSKMMEAIDALGRRVDALAASVGGHTGGPSVDTAVTNRLATIDQRLAELLNTPRQTVPVTTDAPGTIDSASSFTHIVQILERLSGEIKGFGRKLDSTNGQALASLATLSSRSAESLNLLQRASAAIDASAAGSGLSGSYFLWLAVVGIVIGGGVWYKQRSEGGFGRGKKMI